MNDARRGRPRRAGSSTEQVLGIHAVQEALARTPELALEMWLRGGRDDARFRNLRSAAEELGVAVHEVPGETLDRLTDGGAHQGVLLRRRVPPALHFEGLVQRLTGLGRAIVLGLDGVDDPHNLGACLRTAAAVGVEAVVVPRSRGASVTATVRRVASGGAERVPVVEVANLARALEQLSEVGFTRVGLSGTGAADLFEYPFPALTVLVAGGEARGLRRLTRERCDALLHIPMGNGMESLNVSVAAGVALYAVRQAQRCSGAASVSRAPPSFAGRGHSAL